MVLIAPVRAAEGPAPPSAPTPDEAAAVQPGTSSTGQPSSDQGKPEQAKAGQGKPDAVDANAEAVRKAQENGSYRMKDGGMYQPPETRPAPLWNKGYGRT